MVCVNRPLTVHAPSMTVVNPLTPELNPSAQRCLPRLFTGDFNFYGHTARHIYKSFGLKGLIHIPADVT
jgi:hypothetical protein